MTVTPTQLRENIYKILDQVIETQVPVEITRKGHVLKLVVEQKKRQSKLANLKPHPGTLCADPESFVQMDWSSHWQGGKEL